MKHNLETIIVKASTYKNFKDFKNENINLFEVAEKNGWLDEIKILFGKNLLKNKVTRRPNGYWTFEQCKKEAEKYKTRSELKQKISPCYDVAYRNKWLDDICQHMSDAKKPNGFWTKENCILEALKYTNRTDFQKQSSRAYAIARENAWIDDITKHMIDGKLPNGYWTKKTCKSAAKKCKSKSEFSKRFGSGYNIAYKNAWLNEFFPK
jgi:hypothetical protein